mgnify:CR=1 FL=1
MAAEDGLKAQKLLAQGSALGNVGKNKVALKGRVFKIYIIFRHVFCVKIQVKSHEINVL